MFFRFLERAALALGTVLCLLATPAALAGSFPDHPLRLIVPFPAGGSSDILGRTFAEKLQSELGQTVVVDNRAGGNTVIGTQAAASSSPDGYTLLQITPNAVIIGSLQAGLPYDFERDFVPVAGVGAVPLLLAVSAKSDIHSLADLVALAKSTAGGVSYASGGIGSLGHLAPARFLHDLKITGTHIPYRGVSPAMQDVAAGRVHLMFVSSLEGMQMAKAGLVRVLGVTSDQRLASLPDVPTMAELGFPDFTPVVWYGFVVPSKTPPDVVSHLGAAIFKAANDPSVRQRLGALGLTVKLRSAPEFGKYVHEEAARWSRVVKENHIRME
jgi:tripartite-type tricarboxylate transporter receptor subunit TctC